MKRMFMILLAAVFLMASPAAAGLFGDDESPEETRAEIRAERDTALELLYKDQPSARAKVEGAVGYATFSNRNIHLFAVSSGKGAGVLIDNASKQETFMQMLEFGAGIGLGVKTFRVVFVFHDAAAMKLFKEQGFEVGAKAEAGAALEGEGVAATETAAVTVDTDSGDVGTAQTGGAGAVSGIPSGIEVFQLTDTGLTAQATISGTKYWVDDELN